jgi:hypothetical protein
MIERELGAILTGLDRICRGCGINTDKDQEEEKSEYVREDSKSRDRHQQDE